MRTQLLARRAVFLTALLSLFNLSVSGQIQVSGGLFREKICRAGDNYIEEITALNLNEIDIEVWILQGDFDNSLGKDKFLEAGVLENSNANFIKIPAKRILLRKKHKMVLPFKIRVPEETKSGSYHSLIFIQTTVHDVKQNANRSVNVNLRYAFTFVTTVKGGKKDLKIENIEIEEDKLFIDVKNVGTDFIVLKCSPEIEGIKKIRNRIRFFPNLIVRYEFDISEIRDGLYEDVRIIFEDGDMFITIRKISFRKGELPEEVELVELESERLAKRRRRGKPYSLYANLGYGNRRRGFSLTGTLRIWDFSLSAGNTYSQYHYGDVVSDFESRRLSINFRREWFTAGMGNYWYGDKWISTIRMGVNFRRTQASANYSIKYKIISANVSQRVRLFKKNFIFRIYAFKSQYREDWNASIMIPIL